MEKIDIINHILKYIFINLCVLFVFLKITNYKIIKLYKYFFIIIFSIISSIMYVVFAQHVNSIIFLWIIYPIYALILAHITNNKFNFTVIPTTISIVITYSIYIISIVIDAFIIYNAKLEHSNPLNLAIIPIIEILFIYNIFQIKRFKNGFYFLQNTDKIRKIGNFSIIFYTIIILIYGIMHIYENNNISTIMFFISLVVAICFIVWIQNEIIEQYRKNMKNRTIELQKLEIDEQIKNINELKENNLKLSTIIHKYNNRLSALENAVIKTLDENYNTEFSEELTTMLENLKTMSKEFTDEVINATNKKKNIPKTNIQSIDYIFEYMASEAIKNNINFDLKINNSINYLVENIVDIKDFETLIGDHIRDAIIAINSSKTEHRSIMCILGIIDNCFEFSIYDTGIEFEIDTLLNLGIKHITTHSETGGTGIGFMTSFETLNKCKGSLIIEEYSKETNIYTKCITFRFDSKCEYKINSYRAEQIKYKIDDKNRIKIKQI